MKLNTIVATVYVALLSSLFLLAGCDSGTPSGGPLQGTPTVDVDVPATIGAVGMLASTPQPTELAILHSVPTPEADACVLLKNDEVASVMGKAVQSYRDTSTSSAVSNWGARCLFSSDAEYLTLSMIRGKNEAEAAHYFSPYLDSQSPAYSSYVPHTGDAAAIWSLGSATGEGGAPRWTIFVLRKQTFFTLAWLTQKPAPQEGLKKLANLVVTRIDSGLANSGTR